jgi:hypothetical protein
MDEPDTSRALDYARPPERKDIKPSLAGIASITLGLLQKPWLGVVSMLSYLATGEHPPTLLQKCIGMVAAVSPILVAGLLGFISVGKSPSILRRIPGWLGIMIAIGWLGWFIVGFIFGWPPPVQ